MASPGGGGGDRGGRSSGGIVGGYGDLPGLGSDAHRGIEVDGEESSSSAYYSDDDEGMEAPLSMKQRLRLAEIWVANPTTSHHWSHGLGGVRKCFVLSLSTLSFVP